MPVIPYPNFFQGSEWVKRFDSDTGTLRDALGVQVVKVEGLTGTTLEQALQAAQAFDTLAEAGSQTIPSNMEIKEVRQRVVTDGMAEGRVVYGREDDLVVGRARQRPLVTVTQQLLTVNIPVAATTYSAGQSVVADGGGDVLYRPITILQSNITMIEESASPTITLGGTGEGNVNDATWYGLAAGSVLYLGKGVTYYQVGSSVKQDIRHSFVYRKFIKPTALELNSMNPHSIVRYSNARVLAIEAPDSATIPTPI